MAYPSVDKLLLSYKAWYIGATWNLIEYMETKQDKSDIKFYIVIDVKTKYLFNNFPYVQNDLSRSGGAHVPTDMIMIFMTSKFKKGQNVNRDNWSTLSFYRFLMQV